jgi:hypothetical protein
MKLIEKYEGYTYFTYDIDVGKEYYLLYIVDTRYAKTKLQKYARYSNDFSRSYIGRCDTLDIVIHFDQNNIKRSIEKFEKLMLLK